MKKIFSISLILIFQIFILNEFLFFQYINPYLYIIIILFEPIQTNKIKLLLYGFIIGLIIDIGSVTFQDYGPVHAISTLTLAYFRYRFIRLISVRGYNIQDFEFNYLNFYRLNLYLLSATIFHHFLLFYFSYLSNLFFTLKITFFSSLFTIVMLICSYYIFYKRK